MQGVQHLTAQATRLASDNPGIPNGHSNGSYDILSQYARTHAQQGAQHLKVLGGAGMKYLSGAVQIWRAGASPDNTSQPHGSSGSLDLSR